MGKQILEECQVLRDFFVIDISEQLNEIQKKLNEKYELSENQKIEISTWIHKDDFSKINVGGIATKFDGKLTQMDMFFKLK
jgi:hypothetical protein